MSSKQKLQKVETTEVLEKIVAAEKNIPRTINGKKVKLSISENTAFEIGYRIEMIKTQLGYLKAKATNANYNFTDKHTDILVDEICTEIDKTCDILKTPVKKTVTTNWRKYIV